MPTTRAKNVGTDAVSSTVMAFTGLQPGIEVRHFVVTFSATVAEPTSVFLPFVPYAFATLWLVVADGSSCAPASAAASADACSARCCLYAKPRSIASPAIRSIGTIAKTTMMSACPPSGTSRWNGRSGRIRPPGSADAAPPRLLRH
jgi:hypothetical protein